MKFSPHGIVLELPSGGLALQAKLVRTDVLPRSYLSPLVQTHEFPVRAMRAGRKLVLTASYSRFAPESSPRLNGHFELLVGPALLDLGAKFERATGNKLSRGGHSRR